MFKSKTKTFLLSYLLIISCTLESGNSLRVSRSLKESKKEGFFVAEYYVFDAPSELDNLKKISISEVFIEHKWRSNSDLTKQKARDYQIIVNLNKPKSPRYLFDWICEIEGGKELGEYEESMFVANVYEEQIVDTIRINIFQGDVLYKDSTLQPSGQIVLVKK